MFARRTLRKRQRVPQAGARRGNIGSEVVDGNSDDGSDQHRGEECLRVSSLFGTKSRQE